MLDFTHITWNAGAGPLEFQPSYNSATGTSTAVQNLYTLTGNATWSFVKSVPVVKPMLWHPPTDYAFPLSGFALLHGRLRRRRGHAGGQQPQGQLLHDG